MLGPTMVSSGILPNPPASGQVRPVWAPDVGCPNVEKVGFFLLLIEQAENANFVRENNIGLMVTVLGPGSQKPKYPTGVKHVDFLVTYAGGRKEQLKVALPLIVAAFSQGLNVAVHCLSSFHRAPLALCAIGCSLFIRNATVTLKYIGTRRQIYGPYLSDDPLPEPRLADALGWVKTLGQYVCEAHTYHVDPRPSASSQVPVASCRAGAASSSSAAAPAQRSLTAPTRKFDDDCEYLYRAMASEGSEFANSRGSKRILTGEVLVKELFRAVAFGSQERSEFLHFSKEFLSARTWYLRGKFDRGEKHGHMCRIRLADLRALEEQTRAALSQDCDDFTAVVGSVFDFSSTKAVKHTFGRTWGNKDVVESNVYKLRIAMANKEVLVAFRGDIPATMFDVIEIDSGNFIEKLSNVGVDKVAAAVRGPRFVHTSHSQHSTVQIVHGTVLYCSVCTRFYFFRFDVWKS